MTTEEREPFEIHSTNWYNKPLAYKVVTYEANHETRVAKVTLNRPEVMNALSHQLRSELFHALKVAEKDPDINVVIVKGAGRCFSAGYDIGGGMGTEEPDFGSQYAGVSHWSRYLVNQWWQVWELSKIVIAQTHGYVLAGASELCSMCDLLVTTPDCQFGYPPVRAMGAPDVMWFPWLLPKRKAAEMCYTGDSITGQQAFDYGMANYSVPAQDIDEFTENFASRVAIIPWELNTLHKRGFQKAYEIMGIREAFEAHSLQWGLLGVALQALATKHPWYIKMAEARPKGLRQWLTARDGPFDDYRTKEKAILDRTTREGEAWKKVTEEVRPK